ncbi:CDP-alcohol phosphatidyltransferase family protein [Streptomyces sp. NBC_01387]|uniref:CDP-alcohol phosphatidyltransferase family protein n=1 Tax=unclassified Streptomyces TaxID=2593676 RepID=UPI0020241F4D|nr:MULTISPECIES: CDP-alcohol phosphatidyltransferase family protein [unclassified Streptomyces]MCX4553705.1 CDP-alcohol phosphatidyltransferase family protein [Streptomyces sp. NBC_01500]WSV52665.1 CDP-alcohol phosphatidyltransferase family protein [Streptomyces sp. NBC_01014]
MGTVGTALLELRSAQKSAKGVSLYSRFVNRPVGRCLAAVSHGLGLTPNQVTLVSAAFSFAAIAAVMVGEPSWGLGFAVWLGLFLGFAFDSADGQLARLRGGGSPAGEWLDHVVDCAKITALHAAVLIAFYRHPEHFGATDESWLLVPLGFQWAAVVTFFGGLLTEKLKPRPVPGSPAAAPSTLRAVALLPVDHGIFCLVFLLLGAGTGFRWAYTVLACFSVLFLAAFLMKWFRELNAVPR